MHSLYRLRLTRTLLLTALASRHWSLLFHLILRFLLLQVSPISVTACRIDLFSRLDSLHVVRCAFVEYRQSQFEIFRLCINAIIKTLDIRRHLGLHQFCLLNPRVIENFYLLLVLKHLLEFIFVDTLLFKVSYTFHDLFKRNGIISCGKSRWLLRSKYLDLRG